MPSRTKRVVGFVALSAALFVASEAKAVPTVLDDFNRPDGTNMGPSWTEHSGDFQINGGLATGVQVGSTMIYNGATSTTVSIDVYSFGGVVTDYAAVILGFNDNSNMLFIKVQSQDLDADFERVGFYFGNNGNNNASWSQQFFDFLDSPFDSARMQVSLSGNVVTLSLDTNFDSVFDQVYSRGDVPLGLLGSGIGIGGFANDTIRVDNFTADIEAIPEPTTLLLVGGGLLGLARKRFRRAV